MDPETVVELARRVAELETLVRLLAVTIGVLLALLVTGGVLAAMWLRSRHGEVIGGIEGLARGQDDLRDEIHAAELSRALRDERVLIH